MNRLDDMSNCQEDGSRTVVSLARRVLQELSKRPSLARQEWHLEYATWLADYSSEPLGYDAQRVLGSLNGGRMTSDDLILHCVPMTCRILGERWADSDLTFSSVTMASARLYGLCKMATEDWNRTNPLESGASILVVNFDDEDHVIGPTVLAYLLRRQGHSVRLMMQMSAPAVVDLLDVGCFDGLMLSCSTSHGLESVAKAVTHIRARACHVPPIALGGAILGETDGIKEKTGVDLVTNDIHSALNLIGVFTDFPLAKVAE